jgi:foldase protein PrsA
VDEQTGLSEAQFRRLVETNLLREKIREIIGQDVSMNGEKTELRHILTDSQETAQEVRSKLDEGEAWEDLVLEYSQDATTKEDGGDLGWLTEEIILAGFGASAQSLATEPVGTLFGPVQTYQGWDVFEIMGREVQPYTDYEYQLAKNAAFDQWLLEVRGNAEIDVAEDWYTRIPEIDVSQTGY